MRRLEKATKRDEARRGAPSRRAPPSLHHSRALAEVHEAMQQQPQSSGTGPAHGPASSAPTITVSSWTRAKAAKAVAGAARGGGHGGGAAHPAVGGASSVIQLCAPGGGAGGMGAAAAGPGSGSGRAGATTPEPPDPMPMGVAASPGPQR
jgi:hypothetical protein